MSFHVFLRTYYRQPFVGNDGPAVGRRIRSCPVTAFDNCGKIPNRDAFAAHQAYFAGDDPVDPVRPCPTSNYRRYALLSSLYTY